MSTREYAMSILNTLSDEKIAAFITLFSDDNTRARIEAEEIASSSEPKLYDSFREFMEEMEQEDEEILTI